MLKAYLVAYFIYRGITPDPSEGVCDMDQDLLIAQLKRHEGVRLLPYQDSVGKWTIGIGRNLTDRGISLSTAEQMLQEDIELAKTDLDSIYPDWCDLSEERQLVLMDMCVNLGAPRYLTFVKFWAALRQGQWDLAAAEMLDSRWANQVGQRAQTLSAMMREG